MTPKFEAMKELCELIHKAGKDGARMGELAQMRGVSVPTIERQLARLIASREIVKFRHSCKHARFYAAEHAPIGNDWQRGETQVLTTIRSARLTLSSKEPAIVPDGVKVTKCPGFVANQRYAVDPSIAGNGVISRDWMERRA